MRDARRDACDTVDFRQPLDERVHLYGMRTLLLSLALVGCATHTKPAVNVAAVRAEIKPSVGDRRIVSMGHTETDRAIVFTESPDQSRHQEIWVRGATGWKLETSTAVSAN